MIDVFLIAFVSKHSQILPPAYGTDINMSGFLVEKLIELISVQKSKLDTTEALSW